MSNEENWWPPSNIRSSLNDVLGLIGEYPRLALPVGAVVTLLWLATVFKTLFDGFEWAYRWGKFPGVFLVVLAIYLISLMAIWLVTASRPVIKPFPAHCLSRSPIIKWEYRDGKLRNTSYELRVKLIKTGEIKTIAVPARMHQIPIPEDITGLMEISVYALPDGKRSWCSGKVRTEIYRDSVQRIRETGKLRVAVHTDPAEQIFCHFRNGRWQGLDIDFATLIASELEHDPDIMRPVEVEYFFFEWPAIIGAPNEHEVDMALASITISAERSKKYGIYFSGPYAESKLGVVTYSRTFAVEPWDSVKLDMLKGKTVAIHKETTALEFIEQAVKGDRYRDISIEPAENNDRLRELLRDNNVDAVVHDYHRAFTLLEAGMVVYGLDHEMALPANEYGIAFSRVNLLLLNKVDAIIKKHRLRIKTELDLCIEDRRCRAIHADDKNDGSAMDRPAISGKINLFVYGSLMYEAVWRRLVAGEFDRKAAQLSGYRRLKIKNEDYPGLVRGIGTVHGYVWLAVDEQTVRRIDEFEAACYRRMSGVVIDGAGIEIPADFFVIKESDTLLVEEAEWDAAEFERHGLWRFIDSYAGFKS